MNPGGLEAVASHQITLFILHEYDFSYHFILLILRQGIDEPQAEQLESVPCGQILQDIDGSKGGAKSCLDRG